MKIDREDVYNILLLLNMLISSVLLFWRLSGTIKKLGEEFKR